MRDLDLGLSRRHATRLADVLRCSPHLIRNMTQSRGGRVRSRLVAIGQPTQICRPCAHRHAADALTRGTRLRSWMEGWRIACPICGAALEDFRLYTRLFRADPADALLARIGGGARDGERSMDRASKRRGGGAAHAALMRSLLLPQVALRGTRETAAAVPRLLHLVVPGSGTSSSGCRRKPGQAAPGSCRLACASQCLLAWRPYRAVPIIGSPNCSRPPARRTRRDCCMPPGPSPPARTTPSQPPGEPNDSGYCRKIRNLRFGYSHIKWQQARERALFRHFLATRQPGRSYGQR